MVAPKGYTQHDEVIEVPKGTGIEGFVRSIREVLKLPRVQDIRITNQGKIEYSFFLREGEEKRVVTMKFDELMPMALVRNTTVMEVYDRSESAATALMQMFRAAGIDHLQPIAWVTGANSMLWKWYEDTTGLKADIQDELLGLPVHPDRLCPDETLLLCAAFKRESDLAEAKKTYKISIPQVTT